jgi:hypothetical protein
MSDARSVILGSASRLRPTLGSKEWLRQNHKSISFAVPQNWTMAKDPNFLLSFGFAMKMAGVKWSEQADLIIAMQWLTRIGIIESIRAPDSKLGSNILMVRRASFSSPAA